MRKTSDTGAAQSANAQVKEVEGKEKGKEKTSSRGRTVLQVHAGRETHVFCFCPFWFHITSTVPS